MITYDNITVEKYKKLSKIRDIDELIPIVYDIDEKELDIMDMKDYTNLIKGLSGLKHINNIKYSHLKLGENVLFYKDILKLTFGEYLDMITYIKNDQIEYLYAIFFRLIIDTPKLSVPVLEDYSFDIDFRANLFLKESIKYYFQIKKDIERLDEIIKKNFKIIFDEDKNTKEDIGKITDERVKAQYIHEQKIKESFSKNAWQYTVYNLANGDITKFDQIYKTPLIVVLNTLKLQRDLELKNKNKN